ncbi:MAG: YdcF family protein [Betaproteobacteria bacterium]|nr:YdcF family protein [Betaproteobacteria bacterium]
MLVSALLTALISPLGSALALGLLALLLSLTRWRIAAALVGLTGIVWLIVWSLPVTANWIQTHVSRGYDGVISDQQIAATPTAGAIVLLGGGVSPPTPTRPWPDLGEASDRVWQAARLWHAGKAPLIIASGGHDPRVHTQSEAEAMRTVLRAFGIPDSAIVVETRSRNTRQNATDTAAVLADRGIRRVLLVTSASHISRSVSHFRATGLEVIAVPADYESIDYADLRRFIPQAGALDLSARALKEWVGQIVW